MRKGTVCQKHIEAQGGVRKIPISNTSQYQGDFVDVGGAAFALGRCAQSNRIAFMPSHARRTWSGSQRCQITNPTAIRLRGQQVSHEWCAASAMTTLCRSWISTGLKRRPLIDDWRAGHEHQTGASRRREIRVSPPIGKPKQSVGRYWFIRALRDTVRIDPRGTNPLASTRRAQIGKCAVARPSS